MVLQIKGMTIVLHCIESFKFQFSPAEVCKAVTDTAFPDVGVYSKSTGEKQQLLIFLVKNLTETACVSTICPSLAVVPISS